MLGDTLILGIDPALDLRKPMAMALTRFREDGRRHLVSWSPARVSRHRLEHRINFWMEEFEIMLSICQKKHGRLPDMVAIEDQHWHGKGGSHMQCLVTFLEERAQERSIRCELINPTSVKVHATGHGDSETPYVAIVVRNEYLGMDKLPIIAGEYDLEMAVATAGAGYAILQKEALEAQA